MSVARLVGFGGLSCIRVCSALVELFHESVAGLQQDSVDHNMPEVDC
jgi:hypothetical protein